MSKGNLLIVDDETVLLNRLKLNLEDYADEIYTAENGVEALEMIDRHEIHCVICDINMPEMNGVEVVKAIRKNGNEVPFIFYTAHGDSDLMMEAAKYGVFDFLNKPNFGNLEEIILRGLNEGFTRKSGDQRSDEKAFISEYQKILSDLRKV